MTDSADFDVTVIIPTHCRPDFVRAAAESALRQSLPPRAVVVVSDGPDQASREALATLPVKYLESPGRGAAEARNVGIAIADTTWVAFLDDDDLWHPDLLAHVARHARATTECHAFDTAFWTFAAPGYSGWAGSVDFVATTLDECLERAKSAAPTSSTAHLAIEGHSFERLLEKMAGNMSTAVVRRDVVLRAGGFPAGVRCAEDWTMFVNVARFTEWHLVPERLGFSRKHDANNTLAGAINGPATLRAIADVWDDESLPWPKRPDKKSYRGEYAHTLRMALSSALGARRWDLYRESLSQARRLIPAKDMVFAMKPARSDLRQWRNK